MNLLPVPVDVPRLPSVLFYGRAVSPCGVSAPCRNRTCNLMIKSQLRGIGLARTEGVQPFPAPSKVVGLVPPAYPKRARSFPPKSHCLEHQGNGLEVPQTARNTRPHRVQHGSAHHAFGVKTPPNRCRYSSVSRHHPERLTKMVAV